MPIFIIILIFLYFLSFFSKYFLQKLKKTESLCRDYNEYFECNGALGDRLSDLLVVEMHLHLSQPQLALLLDLLAFEVEMAIDDVLEAKRRLLDHLEHGPFDSGLLDVGVVFDGGDGAGGCTTRSLVARLVEVRLGDENERLDRDEHLKERRGLRVPALFWSTVPCVEYTQAHFAVVIEIRVEANRLVACRLQVDHWRRLGIV